MAEEDSSSPREAIEAVRELTRAVYNLVDTVARAIELMEYSMSGDGGDEEPEQQQRPAAYLDGTPVS